MGLSLLGPRCHSGGTLLRGTRTVPSLVRTVLALPLLFNTLLESHVALVTSQYAYPFVSQLPCLASAAYSAAASRPWPLGFFSLSTHLPTSLSLFYLFCSTWCLTLFLIPTPSCMFMGLIQYVCSHTLFLVYFNPLSLSHSLRSFLFVFSYSLLSFLS